MQLFFMHGLQILEAMMFSQNVLVVLESYSTMFLAATNIRQSCPTIELKWTNIPKATPDELTSYTVLTG